MIPIILFTIIGLLLGKTLSGRIWNGFRGLILGTIIALIVSVVFSYCHSLWNTYLTETKELKPLDTCYLINVEDKYFLSKGKEENAQILSEVNESSITFEENVTPYLKIYYKELSPKILKYIGLESSFIKYEYHIPANGIDFYEKKLYY